MPHLPMGSCHSHDNTSSPRAGGCCQCTSSRKMLHAVCTCSRLMPECCTSLQASVAKGSIRLADNGARLAGRLAQLDDDIARQSELVQMYAEQLGPNMAPAMQADSHAPSLNNSASWQNIAEQKQQQQQAMPSSQPTQNAGQQTLKHGVANAHAPQQTAHPARHDGHAFPASCLALAISRPSSRHAAMGRLARSSADNQHRREPHSNGGSQGAERRGRSVGAANKHRQAGQAPVARKGRQGSAIDGRYTVQQINLLLTSLVHVIQSL